MDSGARPVRNQEARPKVAARRARIQRFLLRTCSEGATVEGAISSLLELRSADPARYSAIIGGDWALAHETARDHWQAIPRSLRKDVLAGRRLARNPAWTTRLVLLPLTSVAGICAPARGSGRFRASDYRLAAGPLGDSAWINLIAGRGCSAVNGRSAERHQAEGGDVTKLSHAHRVMETAGRRLA
jgi:hypothetical protein